MRNLSIESRHVWLVEKLENEALSSSCVDVDEGWIFLLSESKSSSTRASETEFRIWKVETQPIGQSASPITRPFVSFRAAKADSAVPPQSALFRVLADSRLLSIVLFGGDIITISLDHESPSVDIVGSVEHGIKAASWSPDEAYLILVSGRDMLIQMTRDFDVIYEAPLRTSEFGEGIVLTEVIGFRILIGISSEKQNTVGWGSKSTQFHGTLGKAAASAPSVTVGSSSDDDSLPRITWRGDAAFFAVSSLEDSETVSVPRSHRVIRVYSPVPSLSLVSTTEPTPGLEHPLSWNSTGSLIASTQRFGSNNPESGLGAGREGRHDVIFFERNGLRRNSFEIVSSGYPPTSGTSSSITNEGYMMRWKYRIVELSWSSDSSILAVWIRSEIVDVVQLWTMSNYHWYLKQSIPSPSASGRLAGMSWHPEDALVLDIISLDTIVRLKLARETCASRMPPPVESGSVAVVDGGNILITPFSIQNVPPPMSSYCIRLTEGNQGASAGLPVRNTPTHITLSHCADLLAVLYNDGLVEVWDLGTNLTPPHLHKGKREDYKVAHPARILRRPLAEDVAGRLAPRQVALFRRNITDIVHEDWGVGILSTLTEGSSIKDVIILNFPNGEMFTVALQTCGSGCLIAAPVGVWFEDLEGLLHEGMAFIDIQNGTIFSPSKRLASFAYNTACFVPHGSDEHVFVGLSQMEAKLFSSSPLRPCIAEHVTSFTITPSYIVYVTASNEAHFVRSSLLSATGSEIKSHGSSLPGEDPTATRRVERGSRIVIAVSSLMNLVLQMPRGNLETIYPRAFAMDVIHADVTSRRYRRAFLACRKHRVDLNILVAHDPQAFISDIEEFMKQVHEVDYLNLFLAQVGQSSQPSSQINNLCDDLRSHLEAKDFVGYINSILTAHVVKSPPDLESALGLLSRLKGQNPEILEDAVKYLIFLVDANTLFDAALGMYDFPLTLLIAQHSQRDPREYIPFLRELRALPSAYQRFRIDDHLRRQAKALIGLRDAELEKFDEALNYIERHRLYGDALHVWNGYPDKLRHIHELHGDYQFERREFSLAALSFTLAGHRRKVVAAYECAHDWREALSAAFNAQLSQDELDNLCKRITDDLLSRKRYSEAARVMLDYSENVEGAVLALVQGNEVSEALRITYLNEKPELVDTVIHPNVLILREEISDEVEEAKDQLAKQSARFVELQRKKLEEPGAFYMNSDAVPPDVEVMTDAGDSVAFTTFTRYTAAPSAMGSKRSARSTNKAERKRGKKGTVDEEEYILASIVKLVSRLETFRCECAKILPHLIAMSEEHLREARSLQATLLSFEADLEATINLMWSGPRPEEVIAPATHKPSLPPRSWSIKLLDTK